MGYPSVTPDIIALLRVLKSCAGIGALLQGRWVHDQAIRLNIKVNLFSNSLVDMYSKCGSIEDARYVFDRLSTKSVVSWAALMGGYIEIGKGHHSFELFERMKGNGIKPNRVIFLCLIKASLSVGCVGQARLVHHEIIKSRFDLELVLGNALMDVYIKFAYLEDALRVFDKLPSRDVVSWDTRIAGLVDHGLSFCALHSYEKMGLEGLKPDNYTFSCVLKACANERLEWHGKMVHDQIIRCGLESNVIVGNTLIDMYGKCGYIEEACKVFKGLACRDVVSWGAVIACCAEHGYDPLSLTFFERMQKVLVSPNAAVFLSVLKACAVAGTLVLGRLLHDQIVRAGLAGKLTMGSTLVNMYGNLGSLDEAKGVFDLMEDQNEVVWGLLMAAHVQHGSCFPVFGLFIKMQGKGIKPSKASYISLLKACSSSGATVCGRLLHGQIVESGLLEDVQVGSTLADMYGKCGSLEDAHKILEDTERGSAESWNAKIAALADTGHLQAAWECLGMMVRQGLKPDAVVFLNLISACTNAGLLDEGCKFFTSMRGDFGIEPTIGEYNAIVDLLGRAGLVEEGEDLLLSMPSCSDVLGWLSLLSCCRASFDRGLARRCLDQIVSLDPMDASGYVLMARMYVNVQSEIRTST